MRKLNINNILTIVMAISMTMVFSCKNNFKEVQKIGISENEPIGEAENIHLKYTDSGKVKVILQSDKMLDFTNRNFPYREFTEGIFLELFGEGGERNVIISDYAVLYLKTDLIDLQGNVKIAMHSKDTLFAQQLYFDQGKEWLFTNKPVTFRTGQDLIHGNGFDSNRDFTNAEVLEITGIITLDE
ncbi:LPS export ABC transporter periplasmic protein LptC [Hyunsoonleella aquatilis]